MPSLFIFDNNVYFISIGLEWDFGEKTVKVISIKEDLQVSAVDIMKCLNYCRILYEHKDNNMITIIAMVMIENKIDSLIKICIMVPGDIGTIDSIRDIVSVQLNYINYEMDLPAHIDKITEEDIRNMKDGDAILAKVLLYNLKGNAD